MIRTMPRATDLAGHVALTGATGFTGSVVLAELLGRTDATVTCLVRASDRESARERVLGVLSSIGGEAALVAAGRVTALDADLGRDELGLDPRARGELLERVTHVVHCGARMRFDTPAPVARAHNVGGLAGVADLALDAGRRGRDVRLTVVSTAFVAGTTDRPFSEHELDVGQAFRNAVELSSFEAEMLARRQMDVLPTCVVRPSIVVGGATGGRGRVPHALDAPLRLLLGPGAGPTLPVRGDLPVDLVPVEWVARLVVEAAAAGRAGETYAAASGNRAPTMDDLAAIACEVFDGEAPSLLPAGTSDDVVGESIAAWRRRLPPLGRPLLDAYAPYLVHGGLFDAWRGDSLMWRAGIPPFDPRGVLEQCVRDARATGFGGRLAAPFRDAA